MKSARLLVMTCLAIGLKAEGPPAGDPFSAYYLAIEGQLSAVLEAERSTPPAIRKTISAGEAMAPNASDEIKTFARRFWGGREEEFAAALDRLRRLRPRLESILDTEGMPKQLAAVVLIESGARPLALSPRRARGLWQLIPETARRYGLVVSDERDERVQLEPATRAAARYLRDLYRHFGDWPLTLAAYNAGQAAVEAALEKGRAKTFWQLESEGLLPSETLGYVPAVVGAMQLIDSTPPILRIGEDSGRRNWVYAPTRIVN